MKFPTANNFSFSDVAAVAEYTRPILTPYLQSCSIYVLNPQDSLQPTMDPTGQTPLGPTTVYPVYAGLAHAQELRRNLPRQETTNNSEARDYEFKLSDYTKDELVPNILPGFQIIVSDCPQNPLLQLGLYVVTGMADSSSAWNVIIQTERNLESVPNYVLADGTIVGA